MNKLPTFNLFKSVEKEINYIAKIAKEDVEVIFLGRIFKFKRPSKVVISPKFYRDEVCELKGNCCHKVRFWNIWFEEESKMFPKNFQDKLRKI